MANVVYLSKTLLTGGTAPALDSIDGTGLVDGDFAHVTVAGVLYVYKLNATLGGAESIPTIIAPDSNAGTKRWVLQGINALEITNNSLTASQTVMTDANKKLVSADYLDQAVKQASSPTFVGETLSGLTASLPVFTGASKELVSKSVADTRTALGLGIADSPTLTALTLTNGQIVFPSTQVPSANANTLDDYEEGTWTPNLAFDGDITGITYNADYHEGTYTKIGNIFRFVANIVLTSKHDHTGTVTILGLPFAVPDADKYGIVISFAPTNAIAYGSYPGGRISNNSAVLVLFKPNATGVGANLTDADFSNNSSFMISGIGKI